MRDTLMIFATLALVVPVASRAQAPAAAQPGTVQSVFDAATALQEKGDYAAALAAWNDLEARVARNRRTLALVRVRKAMALLKLARPDEALTSVRAGLADLPVTENALAEDRFNANLVLGNIHENTLDYSGAVEAFRAALANAGDATAKLTAYRGLVATETFVDTDAATRDMAAANAYLATIKADRTTEALFLRLESELLLNRNEYEGARKKAAAAVDKLGGLTSRIDLNDVAARADYALAALLSKHPDDARKYMAYTGAGRIFNGTFDPAADMDLPNCGGDAGLRPEDAAVIEFSIADDGSVSVSTPIWSAAGGRAALEFARTAQRWSFDPVKLKALPVFYRYRARVEMRCTKAFERPSIGDYLDTELAGWLQRKSVPAPPPEATSDAAALPQQRVRLAAAEARGAGDLAMVLPLVRLAGNSIVSREEANALVRRALAIADAHAAPPLARLAIERLVWASNHGRRPDGEPRDPVAASQLPAYQADPAARAAVRILAADSLRRGERALDLLRPAADEPALPANHPLRVGALIRIASIQFARGQGDAARAAFERTGLAASQCAMLDAPPKMLHSNVSSTDFPNEARLWGFEGWTRTEFDLGADGKVVGERAILSYPPFVFSEAAKQIAGGLSYAKTYRPDGGLGCGAVIAPIRFKLGF